MGDWVVPSPPEPPPSFLKGEEFSILCEIEPSRRPNIDHVREQIGTLAPVVDAFLIPDNHLGRATVSSVAVAHEVAYMGGRSIACINARDRNLLGFRRDLLTAAAYGVDHFLFVYGDAPKEGRRTDDLSVRGMISEVRNFGTGALFEGYADFKIGTVAKVGRPITWRAAADFLFVQITYAPHRLVEWRNQLDFDGNVYAGVMVLASARMARRINATIPDIHVPQRVIDKLESDPEYGIYFALEQIEAIRDCGSFNGVHLVPVTRYRQIAKRLRSLDRTRRLPE